MKHRFCIPLFGLLMFVWSVSDGAASEKRLDRRVAKLLGGEKGVKVITTADKVEAYRIKPEYGAGDDVKKIAGFPLISGPHKVDAGHARVLRRVLFNSKTYMFDVAKACEFEPGIVIRFSGKSGMIDVVFCFSCEELKTELDGKRVGYEDFDRARGILVPVMKQIFPKDAEIQELTLSGK